MRDVCFSSVYCHGRNRPEAVVRRQITAVAAAMRAAKLGIID
jgi:hypothetical protein